MDVSPLLLVHGSPAGPRAWDRLRAELPAHRLVLTPTLQGHARGDAPAPASTTIVDRADAIAAATEEHGPMTVVGHSFGAVVALALALEHPAHMDRLVLLEPVLLGVPGGEDDQHIRSGIDVLETYVSAAERGDTTAISAMIDLWFSTGAFTALPGPAQEHFVRQAPVNMRDVAATIAYRPSPEVLASLSVVPHIVVGTRSPLITHRIAQLLADLSSGVLLALDGAGHGMPDTHAVEIAELLASD